MPAVLRHGLLVLALLGCAALAVAEFNDLYSIRVITVTVKTGSVGAHHGYALLVIAVGAALLAFGAHRGGSRPAGAGVAVLGAAALLVALLVDLPVVGDTGIYGRDYDRAEAHAEVGFKLEVTGAVLVLLAGVAMVVFGSRRVQKVGRQQC